MRRKHTSGGKTTKKKKRTNLIQYGMPHRHFQDLFCNVSANGSHKSTSPFIHLCNTDSIADYTCNRFHQKKTLIAEEKPTSGRLYYQVDLADENLPDRRTIIAWGTFGGTSSMSYFVSSCPSRIRTNMAEVLSVASLFSAVSPNESENYCDHVKSPYSVAYTS